MISFTGLAKRLNWIGDGTKLIYRFDGEVLNNCAHKTAEQLEIEDADLIDVDVEKG